MQNLLILIDYRYQFWLKTNYKEESVNTDLLKSEFIKLGYDVSVKKFSEINFTTDNYKDCFVFYQSSEDPGLLYKSYIEDILLGLKIQGAILIPDFEYLKAHHNKVFMEILREVYGRDTLTAIRSWYFGTYEDYSKTSLVSSDGKHVFKLSEGAQSKNVMLLDTGRKHRKIPEKLSRSFNLYYWLIDQIKPYWESRYPLYRRKSHNRKKFIVQEFIEGLKCDYKVLVFSNASVYVLTRDTRPYDFRASGSGLFRYERDIPESLLDYSIDVLNMFPVPFISLDVALADGKFFVLEFQFVSFGTYTAEKSPFHFQKTEDKWQVIDERIIIENVYAVAIDHFIRKKKQIIEDIVYT